MIQREGLAHETKLATTLQKFRDDEQYVRGREGVTKGGRRALPRRTLKRTSSPRSSPVLKTSPLPPFLAACFFFPQHLETGLAKDAERAPVYPLLSETVKAGCRAAIWVTKRV